MNLGRKGNLMPTLQDPGLSTLDGVGLCPSFDLDFTQGKSYGHRITVPAAPTAARASSALHFTSPFGTFGSIGSLTELYGNNVLRYGNNVSAFHGTNDVVDRWIGLLIEGADQNVIVENTQYAALNWTLVGGPTVTDSTAIHIYDGRSFLIVNAAAGEDYMHQTALLTGEDYFICFLVNYGVGPLTDNQVRVAAGVSGAIAGIASTHEMIGPGLWLVWATFTATAANWDIGVNVRGNKSMYVSLLTCCKVAPTNEGGAFPRSPIPSGAAATTRAAETLNFPMTSNYGLNGGTWDVELVTPCAPAAINTALRFLRMGVDGNNYIYLQLFATVGQQANFSVKSGGGTSRPSRGTMAYARGDIVKLRGIWSTSLLDGVNYSILYGRIGGAAWAQIGANNLAFGGAFSGGASTLYIGSSDTGIYHLGSAIQRLRVYSYPIVGTPAW